VRSKYMKKRQKKLRTLYGSQFFASQGCLIVYNFAFKAITATNTSTNAAAKRLSSFVIRDYYMQPIFTLSLHANSSIDFVSISE